MTLHLIGLPFSELTREWEPEAFTARTRVFGTMMAERGHVTVYAVGRHEMPGVEFVQIRDRAWQARHFPNHTPQLVFSDYDPRRAPWVEFNVHAADAIRERARPGDILGLTMGGSHQMIADLTRDIGLRVVEVGIGYKGITGADDIHRVYESSAWRHYHSGRSAALLESQGNGGADTASDIRNFDATIPRAYDVRDFPAGTGGGGYYAFMGRLIARKGLAIAAQACQRLGAKLMVAGQGVTKVEPGRITGADGTVIEGDVEYVGVIGASERAQLLGEAIATFTPTIYCGPFEGVGVESRLVGTPTIASDHGCFVEQIENGLDGYRCSTMQGFVRAALDAPQIDRARVRERATTTYGTEALGPVWDAYLRKLVTLRRQGWYELAPEPLRRCA